MLLAVASGRDDRDEPAHDAQRTSAIDAHSETTAMIGDRMDTDIVAGMEAGLEIADLVDMIRPPSSPD